MFQFIRHLICVFLVSLLAACGGGKNADLTVTVDSTVTAIDSPAFNTLSSFQITGNNLRYASPLAISGCAADAKSLGQNNGFMIFQCTVIGSTVQIAVLDATTNNVVAILTTTVPRPAVTYTISTITPNTSGTDVARLGATSTFNVAGSNLYAGLVDITSDDCLSLTVKTSSTDQLRPINQIECLPISATPAFKVIALDDGTTVLNTFTADFNALPIAPLTLASKQALVIGTQNDYTISGYFSKATDVTITSTGCNAITNKVFTPQTGTSTFSCTPTSRDVVFDIVDQNSASVGSVTVPMIASITPDPTSTITPQLGATSEFNITGSSLLADTMTITSDQCLGILLLRSQTTPREYIKIKCRSIAAAPVFKVVTIDGTSFFSTFTADFSALPNAPLAISSTQALTIGTKTDYTLSGYFSEASDVTVTATGCSTITNKVFTPQTGSLNFSCTPTSNDVVFAIANQNSAPIAAVTVPRITNITPDTSSATPAQLGAVSQFNVTGSGLLASVARITSTDCINLTMASSTSEPPQIIKIQCQALKPNPSFTVLPLSNSNVLSTFTADLSALPKAPLRALAKVPSVVGTENVYSITGYFDLATDANVTSTHCTGITAKTFTASAATLKFSCTPTDLDVTFDVVNQSNTPLGSPVMPIQVGIEMTVGADTTPSKFLLLNLDIQHAPITVKNFLAYVESGYYAEERNEAGTLVQEGTLIHRIENDPSFALIQGGAFTSKEAANTNTAKLGAFAAIALEDTRQTGLSNTAGTLAMARTAAPNSATSQFYLNISNNAAALDYQSPSAPGYAVFGIVTDTDSQAMLESFSSIPLDAGKTIPSTNIRITDIYRVQ